MKIYIPQRLCTSIDVDGTTVNIKDFRTTGAVGVMVAFYDKEDAETFAPDSVIVEADWEKPE